MIRSLVMHDNKGYERRDQQNPKHTDILNWLRGKFSEGCKVLFVKQNMVRKEICLPHQYLSSYYIIYERKKVTN